ncbi:hypothetical protein Tco_0606764 [Tanacetum coccineum]
MFSSYKDARHKLFNYTSRSSYNYEAKLKIDATKDSPLITYIYFKMSWDQYGGLSFLEFICILIDELQVTRKHGYVRLFLYPTVNDFKAGRQFAIFIRKIDLYVVCLEDFHGKVYELGLPDQKNRAWVGYDVLNDPILRVILYCDDPWAWNCGGFALMFSEPCRSCRRCGKRFPFVLERRKSARMSLLEPNPIRKNTQSVKPKKLELYNRYVEDSLNVYLWQKGTQNFDVPIGGVGRLGFGNGGGRYDDDTGGAVRGVLSGFPISVFCHAALEDVRIVFSNVTLLGLFFVTFVVGWGFWIAGASFVLSRIGDAWFLIFDFLKSVAGLSPQPSRVHNRAESTTEPTTNRSYVNSAGNIKCPCKACRTVLWVSIKNLPKHITRYGWDPGYKTWVHHGEPDLPPSSPVIDNTRQPQMSVMIALLNDLSYIPPNNKQNEPTRGDIGETSNEPTQAKHSEFKELYASANEELYPSCDYVTRLDFMAKFTYFKVKGKLIDSIFNEMLEFFQHVFPAIKGYKLPPSYYAINKTFKMIGLGYESIHTCVNDCFLFWGDNNKDVHFCPVCKTSRWKDNNTPGKKDPKKVLRYFRIIPRLQRLYKSSHTAKEMTWHATEKCTEPGKMQHPVDGRAWKNFNPKYPNFAKEPRNVRLRLAVDGFNLFGNLSQAYSMWPVILTTYNLPPWLCIKESSFMLTLLIPGPKSLGKDIDVYLRPLIDDLKVLWALKVSRL